MKNLLILLGILLSSPFVVAQHLAINGNVAIANNSPEGTRVVVIKNGNKLDEQVLNKKGPVSYTHLDVYKRQRGEIPYTFRTE